MGVFANAAFDSHEQVAFFSDAASGLRAIIAIHRTGALGTAGGGCRMWPYRHEDDALRDALRLSRAMTYKLALVEIPAGGAKAVVIADPATQKTEALLEALGRAVDRLAGRFIISEDAGINPDDLAVVARSTVWVSRDEQSAGDGAEATAYGVLVGLRTAVRRRLGRLDLRGLRVAVQGLGRVGRALCRLLAKGGARLIVTDLNASAVATVARELAATAVKPAEIFTEDADVFAPCALADALDERTVPLLRCAVVAGSANNQLADPGLADALAARQILYAPDFAINSGGVIGAASRGRDAAGLRERLDSLGGLLDTIFDRAERDGTSTHVAAERIARTRFSVLER